MGAGAFIGAAVGLAGMAATTVYCNKVENRLKRYLFGATGVIASISFMGIVSGLFSNGDIQECGKAGEYLVYMVATGVICKTLFGKKENKKKGF